MVQESKDLLDVDIVLRIKNYIDGTCYGVKKNRDATQHKEFKETIKTRFDITDTRALIILGTLGLKQRSNGARIVYDYTFPDVSYKQLLYWDAERAKVYDGATEDDV